MPYAIYLLLRPGLLQSEEETFFKNQSAFVISTSLRLALVEMDRAERRGYVQFFDRILCCEYITSLRLTHAAISFDCRYAQITSPLRTAHLICATHWWIYPLVSFSFRYGGNQAPLARYSSVSMWDRSKCNDNIKHVYSKYFLLCQPRGPINQPSNWQSRIEDTRYYDIKWC